MLHSFFIFIFYVGRGYDKFFKNQDAFSNAHMKKARILVMFLKDEKT